MEERMGVMFLVMLLSSALACGARELESRDDRWNIIAGNSATSELRRNPDVCALCEEYTAMALNYLNQNKTRSEIIEILHKSCSQLQSLEEQCITLVDYYAPLFLEIETIQPEDFCNKVNLCQQISNILLQVQENSCEFCKDTVSTLLSKLKDPDTKLEVIETLLKVCNTVEKYAEKCKKMVLEYGPLVFFNAEKFLESSDICTALHACKASSTAVNQKVFLSKS